MLRGSAIILLLVAAVLGVATNLAAVVLPILLLPVTLPIATGIYVVDALSCKCKCCNKCKCD